MLKRFTPPGNLNDLKTDSQLQGWSDKHIHKYFTSELASVQSCVGAGHVQFIDPLVRDLGNDQRKVSWPAFPIGLLAQGLTRDEAFARADDPVHGREVQDEYLEWFIERDANGEITGVDFTCEGPEYWQYLSETLSKQDFVKLYQIANPAVAESGLFDANGSYDPFNDFNTTKGIMHLIHGANTLGAEIDIVAQSTMLRDKPSVVSCKRCHSTSAIGDARRKSDPTIASNVNQLALDGRAITILDPVGLYIDGIDTKGWTTPDGTDPQSLFKITRGNPGVRARFEIPGKKFKISDVKIGGEAIRFAGQIAEHVSIKVTAVVGPKGEFTHSPKVPCTGAGPVHALVAAVKSELDKMPVRSHG
jgi:hypothetical protein